jgi:tetratricopeptide (TPR) repeat protein
VERALLEARELSADLHEAAALRVLSGAEQALLDALALPGVHAFLAEVYMQLALCAAQLDEYGLFESALERALSLDPNRRIEAAEAPPTILQRARALARRHDLAPFSEGRIEVLLARGSARFDAEPASASAWLDGVRIATRDLTFRVRAGIHLLVVRARGHAPYATLLSLGPGKRPSQRIALSPSLLEIARLALNGTRKPAVREQRARALALAAGKDMYLFQVGQGPRARALVQRCSERRCSQAVGLDETGEETPSFADAARARAWLNAARPAPLAADDGAPKRQERPIWRRWPLWTGSAALVLAGVVTAVWVTRPDHRAQQRSLEIDASALPR